MFSRYFSQSNYFFSFLMICIFVLAFVYNLHVTWYLTNLSIDTFIKPENSSTTYTNSRLLFCRLNQHYYLTILQLLLTNQYTEYRLPINELDSIAFTMQILLRIWSTHSSTPTIFIGDSLLTSDLVVDRANISHAN